MKALNINSISLFLGIFGLVRANNINTTSPNLEVVSDQDVVPVKRIHGTGLFSGIFYKMGMKRFPSACITWTSAKTDDGKNNYVFIERDPYYVDFYEEGNIWADDSKWAFLPNSDSQDGYFTLRNKENPASLLTVLQEKLGRYHHLILQRNPEEEIPVLWKPIETSESNEGLYQLKGDSYPNGTVTWTYKEYSNNSNYLQMSLNENDKPKYLKGEKWYDDTLFQFPNPIPGFGASISHFEPLNKNSMDTDGNVKGPISYPASKISTTRKTMKHTLYENDNEGSSLLKPISDSRIIKNTMRFIPAGNLKRINLKSFNWMNGSKLSLSNLTSKSLKIQGDFHLQSFDVHGVLSFSNSIKFSQNKTIKILPKKSRKISIYYDTMEVDIPVKLWLKINFESEVDRILRDFSGVRKGPLPLEVVVQELRAMGLVIEDNQQFTDRNFEKTRVVSMSGRIKGSFVSDVGITNEAGESDRLSQDWLLINSKHLFSNIPYR